MLFINSSRKSDTIYERLAKQYANDTHRILPLYEINRVLMQLENLRFFNIGMRNRRSNSSTESYRIITGASAEKAITQSDGRMYHRGHVFGKAGNDINPINIGYSSGSKVWSSAYSQIPGLIDWCQILAEKIESDNPCLTLSRLDFLRVGEPTMRVPEGILVVDWDKQAYKRHTRVKYITHDNEVIECELLDLELRVNHSECTDRNIQIQICGRGLELIINFAINVTPYFSLVSPDQGFEIIGRYESTSILDYLNNNLLNFYFADFSLLRGNEIFKFNRDQLEPFDREQIGITDWTAQNVDITKEFDGHGQSQNGRISIHEFLNNYLNTDDVDIILYDHRSGEVADFITFYERDDRVVMTFYHVKGSGMVAPGSRVADVYEVCGQVVKSLTWLNDNSRLISKIRRRVDGGSRFIKGDFNQLRAIFDRAISKRSVYRMMIVQPGISRSNFSDNIGYVLAATYDYARSENCEELIVMGSL